MKKLFYCLVIGAAVAVASCSTKPPTIAYQAVQGTSVSVEVALGAWDQWVKAGKATIAQEQQVEAAYEKYQQAFGVMCDAGAVWSASENTTNSTAATSAYEFAAQNVSTELNDVVNLIRSFGVKI